MADVVVVLSKRVARSREDVAALGKESVGAGRKYLSVGGLLARVSVKESVGCSGGSDTRSVSSGA